MVSEEEKVRSKDNKLGQAESWQNQSETQIEWWVKFWKGKDRKNKAKEQGKLRVQKRKKFSPKLKKGSYEFAEGFRRINYFFSDTKNLGF